MVSQAHNLERERAQGAGGATGTRHCDQTAPRSVDYTVTATYDRHACETGTTSRMVDMATIELSLPAVPHQAGSYPMVASLFLSNWFVTNRRTMLDLPTPVWPSSTTLTSRASSSCTNTRCSTSVTTSAHAMAAAARAGPASAQTRHARGNVQRDSGPGPAHAAAIAHTLRQTVTQLHATPHCLLVMARDSASSPDDRHPRGPHTFSPHAAPCSSYCR